MGVTSYADDPPALPVPEHAWICMYNATNSGLPFRWGDGRLVRQVTGQDLANLGSAMDGLRAGEQPQACTADLGPRVAVVMESGRRRVALIVDQFSCGDIRLTDDLATVEAGAPTGPGTVRGIIGATEEFRGLVRDLASVAR